MSSSLSSSNCVSPGNPWTSDKRERFAYLMSLLHSRLPSDAQSCDSNKNGTDKPSPPEEIKLVSKKALWVDLIKIVIGDEKRLITEESCPPVTDKDKEMVKELVSTECDKLGQPRVEAVFSRLLKQSTSCTTNSNVMTSCISMIVELVLEFLLVNQSAEFAQNLCDLLTQLAKEGNGLVFQTVLPTILKFGAGRYTSFVQSILSASSDMLRIETLLAFCNGDAIWPCETFGVLKFLFTQIRSNAHFLRDDVNWTNHILRAFQKQYMLDVKLYDSASFANLLLIFMRSHLNEVTPNSWNLLRDMAQQQNNFMKNPICQIIDSELNTTGSPTL